LNLILIIISIVCILGVITLMFNTYSDSESYMSKYEREKIKTEYYKTQMLSLCNITAIQTGMLEDIYPELDFPQTTPCEKWILDEDK